MRRKFLLVLAAVALGGCAAYPYDPAYDNGYYATNGYYGSPYYGPGYYTGPTVGFGVTYVDRDGDYRHHHHHWREYP